MNDQDPGVLELAEAMYAAFGDSMGWKSASGIPILEWTALPPALAAAWYAAAVRAVEHCAVRIVLKAVAQATA